MPRSPTIVWRRLDVHGREAAGVRELRGGWRLSGIAEFEHDGTTACLAYAARCDRAWQTRDCEITGFIGRTPIAAWLERDDAGQWTLDNIPIPDVTGCVDIDLAFSPITNLLPIRRLMLPVGTGAQVRAAWLRFPELTLEVLEQRYTRLATDRYLYESAGGEFRRELTVSESGLVLDYPGLWTSDSTPQ